MSAIAITPVEIWAKIIHHASTDPIIFRSDPFYPGCNLHTALKEWHDYAPIIEARRRRATLRLVSRSWKVLVDTNECWLLESRHLDEESLVQSRWRSARRIHLQALPSECTCEEACSRIIDDYYPCRSSQLSAGNVSLHFIPALHKLQELSSIPVRTMVVSAQIWDIINKYLPEKTIATIFSQLQALEVVGSSKASLTAVPTFLKSLTYLNISLATYGEEGPLTFPSLTTLRVCLRQTDSFKYVEQWTMPNLRHLEIRDLFSQQNLSEINEYLKRGWPLLESFRLIVDHGAIFIPNDIWASLPNLTYVGFTRLWFDQALSPTNHPLHTLALLILDDGSMRSRRTLADVMLNFLNLRVVADTHRWEDIPTELIQAEAIYSSFYHKHVYPLCFLCVMDLELACEQVGLRYEDRWGRSLEEFKSGLIKA